jgi:glycerol-3-phosphate acyltransferase PlsX
MTNRTRPVIAVDAMGGDHGPEVVVSGALDAMPPDFPYELHLYGEQDAVATALAKRSLAGAPVTIIPCSQDIEMGESPAAAIRSKKDSPIVRAMTDHSQGLVQGVVSAGSTGAMVAASLIILGRIPGVDRPAIATMIPTVNGQLLMLDAGANVQCTAEHILSFAKMGQVFSREMMGLTNPAVGQLNIGGEPKKGTDLNVEAFRLLEKSDLNFVGNIEGNQLMLGPCDVVVTDGFTGNNTLKMVEGFARFMLVLSQRSDLTSEEKAAFGPILRFLDKNFSYEVQGGAMLLGVAGISIIAHGRSSARAITNAVNEAWEQIQNDLPGKLAAAQS